jgi:ribosomal protein S18 acetylase RimI-like enzyme
MQADTVKRTKVIPLDRGHIAEAADVMARAFQAEPITSNALDLSTGWSLRVFAQSVELWLETFRRWRQPLLVATLGDRVVGMAIVDAPDRRAGFPFRFLLTTILPFLPLLVRFVSLLRWRRALRMKGLARPPRDLPRRRYTLLSIAVAPERQGQGVGRLLLDEVHRIAESSTWSSGIYLYTGSEKNRSLYERFGYRVVRTQTDSSLVVYHMLRPTSPESEVAAGR